MDSQRIYDIYLASRQTALLTVAVRLNVFEILDRAPLTQVELARRCGISERGCDAMLVGLQALHLIHRNVDGFSTSEEASRFLVPGREGYLGDLIDLEMSHFLTPERLFEALVSGRPGVYGAEHSEDAWLTHAQDSEKARRFTLGMHSISELPAKALATRLELSDHQSILDVGGGSGVFVIAMLRRWSHLRGTVIDLEPVCDVANELFQKAGLSERASTQTLDMFNDPYPDGHDVILFSQILHDWDTDSNRRLLGRAWTALPSGGMIVIHEKLLDDERTGPLANALVSLDMLYWTEGKQYSSREIHEMLLGAGFVEPSTQKTAGYWSVVTAYKP